MGRTNIKLQHKTWRKGTYVVNTDHSLIPLPKLNEIFASDDVYWAKPLPEDVLADMLQNSLCFGLYQTDREPNSNDANEEPETLKFIGIARCITDFATFIYMTDVYVYPELQGQGLGQWLIKCVVEVIDSMPHLRRSMLLTGDWKRSVPFYEKLMGMTVHEARRSSDGKSGEGLAVLMRKGRGNPDYGNP